PRREARGRMACEAWWDLEPRAVEIHATGDVAHLERGAQGRFGVGPLEARREHDLVVLAGGGLRIDTGDLDQEPTQERPALAHLRQLRHLQLDAPERRAHLDPLGLQAEPLTVAELAHDAAGEGAHV